jgi:DNA-binding CsgD family transcriptional regulator
MNSPIPLCITTLKDGIYIDVNETGARYMGAKREDMIGRKSTEIGSISKEQRQLFIDQIKNDGFVKNILLTIKIDNEFIPILMASYKFKQGKADLLFNFFYSIPNHKKYINSFQNDSFYKLALLDLQYIKDKLKPYKLSPRQKEITILFATGKSNREIAEKLFISLNTVKDYLKDIYNIVDIHHRSELIPKLLNLS